MDQARAAARRPARRGHPNVEVTIAWPRYQRLRFAFAAPSLADGKTIAKQVVASFPSCLIHEIARLGRTLRAWRERFLACFTADRANNGGTGAINGIIDSTAALPAAFATPTTTDYR